MNSVPCSSRFWLCCLLAIVVRTTTTTTTLQVVDGFTTRLLIISSSSSSSLSSSTSSLLSSSSSSSSDNNISNNNNNPPTPPTDNKKGIAIIAGATGYIGKSCVRESVRQGYYTIALVRDVNKVTKTTEGRRLYGDFFEGANIVQCDVSNEQQLSNVFQQIKDNSNGRSIDAVVSCLASRSGIKREAFAIDYQATLNCLKAGADCGARHFVLLSAICVRKPLLQFQLAKLQFEQELQMQSAMTYSIVRPTAFFKSVSGQLERLQKGKPFLMFQASTRANPIAESDLATYLIDCISMPNRWNQVLNLGGPDRPMTKQEQGEVSLMNLN
jgi:divinyl chlorophyllide a 8-vinyl-reductase